MENRIAEAQLVEQSQRDCYRCCKSDNNDKPVEGDGRDPTDGEADFEETAAMAVEDGEVIVFAQRLFAWTWMTPRRFHRHSHHPGRFYQPWQVVQGTRRL